MKRMLIKRKKNSKGFTLIELLAVILILGVIALIAVPTISTVINESKQSAAESSAKEYVKSVEEKYVVSSMGGKILADGDYTVDEIDELGLDLKGDEPEAGYVLVEDGAVSKYSLQYDNYVISYDGVNVTTIQSDLESWEVAENSSYIAKVYYNPTTGTKCTLNDVNTNLDSYSTSKTDSNGNKSKVGLKDGCMIWYAYKDNGDGTVKMILDHNTTSSSAAAKSDSDTSLSILYSTLSSDTKNWKVAADVIDIDDIAKIVGADKVLGFSSKNSYFKDENCTKTTYFNLSNADTSYESNPYKYFWLMENLYGSNNYFARVIDTNYFSFGYWAKNVAVNDYNIYNYLYAWSIGSADFFDNAGVLYTYMGASIIGANQATAESVIGIRPVITVKYDDFK